MTRSLRTLCAGSAIAAALVASIGSTSQRLYPIPEGLSDYDRQELVVPARADGSESVIHVRIESTRAIRHSVGVSARLSAADVAHTVEVSWADDDGALGASHTLDDATRVTGESAELALDCDRVACRSDAVVRVHVTRLDEADDDAHLMLLVSGTAEYGADEPAEDDHVTIARVVSSRAR